MPAYHRRPSTPPPARPESLPVTSDQTMVSRDGGCPFVSCSSKVLRRLLEFSETFASCDSDELSVFDSHDATPKLEQSLTFLLDVFEHDLGATRARIDLRHPLSHSVFAEQSRGLQDCAPSRDRIVQVADAICDSQQTLIQSHEQGTTLLGVPMIHAHHSFGTMVLELEGANNSIAEFGQDLLGVVGRMLAQTMESCIDLSQLRAKNRRLQNVLKERFRPKNIIGNSKPMLELYEMIDKVARMKTTVLILGESGVGKELVAHAMHFHSEVSNGPFVKFNCAALPESIVESELFGHEKGAFTGANSMRKGRFEESHGGTIFLDEVGELSLNVQAKLLRVLQERTFERVGGNRPITVSVRVLAATNRDLPAMVKAGTFREDLYYRLSVFPVTIPPLRQRGADIIALADHFVARFSKETGKSVKRISTPALDMLMVYHWPGNVRELENVIERAVILSEDDVVHGHTLPPSLQTAEASGTAFGGDLQGRLQALEYEMLVEALKATNGNVTRAASQLGITRRILGLRLTHFGISYRRFRGNDPNADDEDVDSSSDGGLRD